MLNRKFSVSTAYFSYTNHQTVQKLTKKLHRPPANLYLSGKLKYTKNEAGRKK